MRNLSVILEGIMPTSIPDKGGASSRRRSPSAAAADNGKQPDQQPAKRSFSGITPPAQQVLDEAKIKLQQGAQRSLFDVAPWADNLRALPNDVARMALFTTRNKRVPRAPMQNAAIFHINKDVDVRFTGIELRAEDDELVWQQVLEYAKRTPLGEPVTFSLYQICTDVGWSINGRYYKKVEECLTRLQASALQISSQRLGRLESLSLISRFRVVERGRSGSVCQVYMDEEIVILFAGDHYTKFVWVTYRELSPTARRLYDYCGSHKQPYPLTLAKFRLMCGSESARDNKWREQTRKVCAELTESGLVQQCWVDRNSVHFER